MQFAGCGAALFGAHGSFVLIPAELERQVDFDFGPSGSITEDIYFALRLRELGIPFRWIQGYVREQSPTDPNNFLRQRARWIHGLLNGCLDQAFSWRRRAVLLIYLAMWRTTIISALVLTCVVLASSWSGDATALWSFSMLVVGTNSWVGALRNIEEEGAVDPMIAGCRLALCVALIPVVCLFESVALVLGVVSRPRDFFVVQKVIPDNLAQGSVA
jgi:egghead protein (zeste-white 4 protein)